MPAHYGNQYYAPKWRARVLPDSKCFYFASGEKVCTLWDLKQALKSVPNDVFEKHVGQGYNHIADWVQNIVGDLDLAKLFRSSSNRWGMIVNLERHMMRLLYVPRYVAQRWLSPGEYSFYLASGRHIWSLYELRDALRGVDDASIQVHLVHEPNDFVAWINQGIGDYLLADLLTGVKNKDQLLMRLSDHIVMLEDAAEVDRGE